MFAKIIGGAICGVIFMAIIFLLNSMTGIISESSPTAIIYIIGIFACAIGYIIIFHFFGFNSIILINGNFVNVITIWFEPDKFGK